jgi:uncharacterized protein
MPKNDFIVILARTLDEALEKASNHLKKNRDEINYEILEHGDKIKVKIYLDRKSDKGGISSDSSDANGYFKIKYNDGLANLQVFPPKGKGVPVYPEEVVNRMKILEIPKINFDLIKDIVDRAESTPETVSPWPDGTLFRPSVDIRISEDKMKAFVTLHKAKKDGDGITLEDILSEIASYGIVYGLNERLIGQMPLKGVYENEVCIAEGKQPLNQDGVRIRYNFDTNPGKPFLMDEYGSVNLKELNFIQNKKKGDILAETILPEKGENGTDIFGNTVFHTTGKDEDVRPGKNTRLSEDGLKIIAEIDGNVILKNKTVHVEPVVIVENVDYETGNIDFEGSVLVNGTVLDGFSVRAGGMVQIGLSVGKVLIHSGEDVVLKAGMNGNLEGKIECGGDVYARFVEGTYINCKGNIFVEEAVMNSYLDVGRNLILTGRRAEIIGGYAVVGRSIRCKKIGNGSGIRTRITMSLDPEKMKILDDLKRKIEINRSRMKEISEKVYRLEKAKTAGFKNTGEIEDAVSNYMSLESRLKDEISVMEKDYKDAKRLLEPYKNSLIIVESRVFSGVEILFGETELKMAGREKNKVVLKSVNNEIKEYGFNYKEMPELYVD